MTATHTMRTALEAALVDNPDDLATHLAYADFLNDQGDPRGEFIQVQFALEDPARSAEERKRLRERERQLLDAHEREWLGELAPLLLGTPGLITDAGAQRLAACADTQRLQVLDLIRNRLTEAGITALSQAGIKARTNRQLLPGPREDEYLWAGDSE